MFSSHSIFYFSRATTVEILWFSCHPQWCEKSSRLAFLLTRWSGKSSRTSCWTTDSCWWKWGFPKMGGTPRLSILIWFSLLKHPGMGVPPFQETPVWLFSVLGKVGLWSGFSGKMVEIGWFWGSIKGLEFERHPRWFHPPMFFQKMPRCALRDLPSGYDEHSHGIDGP